MKRLLFLALCLLPSWAGAATYYVDCAAAAGGDGSLATPWDALADVNAASFSAGDSVLLKKGCTFRETLTVPSSGSAGNPITFGAYGSGAAPIIDGADVFASFTTEPGTTTATVTPAVAANGDDSHMWQGGWWGTETYFKMGETSGKVDAEARWQLDVPQGATITTAKVTFRAKEAYDGTGCTVSIQGHDADTAAAVTDAITFTAAKSATTTATVAWSPATQTSPNTYDTPEIKTIIQEIVNRAGWSANNYLRIMFIADAGATDRVSESAKDDGTTAPALTVSYEVTGADTYYKAYTTQPTQVFFDGMKLTKQTVKASLATGEWYDDTDNTRVYLFDNPSGHTVEFSQRSKGITVSTKDYVTIDGLTVQRSNALGIDAVGDTDNLTVQNCTSTYNFTHGIQVYSATSTQSNVVISGNTVSYNGSDGIQVSRNSNTVAVSSNAVHHNAIENGELFLAGIKVVGSTAPIPLNVTVERNTVYSNGDDTDEYRGVGIWADTAGTGCVIRYNRVYDNSTIGIEIEKTVSAQVYYNIVTGHTNYNAAKYMGAGIYVAGNTAEGVSTDNLVYNNVLSGNRVNISNEGADAAGTCLRNIFRNNISVSPTGTDYRHLSVWGGGENDGTNGTGNVYEYNAFGGEPLAIAYPAGAAIVTTYAGFATAYGAATHSVTTDPLFLGASDFHLQNSSPAINAGVNVGLTSDFVGTSVPFSNAPDIGAYEWWTAPAVPSTTAGRAGGFGPRGISRP